MACCTYVLSCCGAFAGRHAAQAESTSSPPAGIRGEGLDEERDHGGEAEDAVEAVLVGKMDRCTSLPDCRSSPYSIAAPDVCLANPPAFRVQGSSQACAMHTGASLTLSSTHTDTRTHTHTTPSSTGERGQGKPTWLCAKVNNVACAGGLQDGEAVVTEGGGIEGSVAGACVRACMVEPPLRAPL